MFKRFIKAVKDVAKKVWEFIKKLLPKKPKPKEEIVEPDEEGDKPAEPEVLVILNAAIANRYFDFPTGKIEAHPDFRIIAAGNTFGTGADHVYSGRYCLDGASLDRFNTVLVPYSQKIEEAITGGDTELLEFCHEFRKLAKDSGNKVIFSYRGLGSIAKLKDSMPLEDVLKICLVKGMDKDDLQLMQKGLADKLPNNRYNQAFVHIC